MYACVCVYIYIHTHTYIHTHIHNHLQVCENRMIELEGASWGWNNQPLYKKCSVVIEKGMRLVILGPNGCGKSTFLAALSGKLPLLEVRS
jgi:ABC-type molybdenum transport system ATPase subunit/photorepair protein PhrA